MSSCMDISQIMTNFHSLSREKKKELCATVLLEARSKGGIFEELSSLIETDAISDDELDAIYESSMIVLSGEEEKKIIESMTKLSETRDRLLLLQEQERKEREYEIA